MPSQIPDLSDHPPLIVNFIAIGENCQDIAKKTTKVMLPYKKVEILTKVGLQEPENTRHSFSL